MKKNIQFCITVLLSICILSCTSRPKKKEKASNPKNELFLVDETFCKEKNLPIIEFSVEYPKDMKAFPAEISEFTNRIYGTITKFRDGSTILESVQIERLSAIESSQKKIDKQKILRNILKEYQLLFSSFTDGETGVFEVNGKEYAMMRGKIRGQFNGTNAGTLTGEYHIQSVIVMNDEDDSSGLILTFLADQKRTDIKTYTDFFTKGGSVDIWETLEFY